MLCLEKVVTDIVSDGLYGLLYEDIKKVVRLSTPPPQAMIKLLESAPHFLEEFMRINREAGLSNIHLKELSISKDEQGAGPVRAKINAGREKLIALEKFSASANKGSYVLWISSAAALFIFAGHTFFAMMTRMYERQPGIVFGLYFLIVAAAAVVYKAAIVRHARQHAHFNAIYAQTQALIQEALADNLVRKEELF